VENLMGRIFQITGKINDIFAASLGGKFPTKADDVFNLMNNVGIDIGCILRYIFDFKDPKTLQ